MQRQFCIHRHFISLTSMSSSHILRDMQLSQKLLLESMKIKKRLCRPTVSQFLPFLWLLLAQFKEHHLILRMIKDSKMLTRKLKICIRIFSKFFWRTTFYLFILIKHTPECSRIPQWSWRCLQIRREVQSQLRVAAKWWIP